jgi:diguanylate cyclase (GGDEF)-like protein
MDLFIPAYLTCLAILVVVVTGIAIRTFLAWRTPGARTLGFLLAAMAVWAGFYLLEIAHPSLAVKILARKILYLGMTLSPPLWLGFALRYTGIGKWWSEKGRAFLLTIPGIIAFLLGLTNERHHLIWKTISIIHESPSPLNLEYGPGFWMFTVIAYAMILAGIAVYIVGYFNHGRVMRVKSGLILFGAILTAAANLVFLALQNGVSIDPTPLSFGLSAPMLAVGFYRFGISSLFPLAAALVVENLQDAIIVVNREDEITDINRKALQLVGIKKVGEKEPVFSILPHGEQVQKIWNTPEDSTQIEIARGDASSCYKVRVIPIGGENETLIGRVIVYQDVTREQRLLVNEQRRSKQLALLEEAGRKIANTFDEREILQRAVDAITNNFGYAETAISILTADGMLEVAAISGTEDFGYRPGFRQELGVGIIGHTAKLQKTYVSGNVSKDAHYFSTDIRTGSAVCAPIFKQDSVFGVLYVESLEQNAFDELDVVTLETLASQISESLQRAALYAQTQSDLKTLAMIQETSKLVAGFLDLETISQTVVENLKGTFHYSHASIYFLKDDYLNLAAQVGYPEEMIIKNIHVSQGVSGRAIRTKEIQFIEDTSKDSSFLKADTNLTSEICVPLMKEDRVLGTLNVESSREKRLTPKDVELLSAIAGPIAISVDNARLHAELRAMATTDAVTSLSNRHLFEQAIRAEVERAERNGSQLSLIIFDIDNFKEYNDAWGHPAGDARLRAMADIIRETLRKYDIAARYGGDEFAIILSECDRDKALMYAQRLRQGIIAGAPNAPANDAPVPGYTLSIGIATYPVDAVQPGELVIAADHAALRAKQQGRNRVKFAGDYETP